MRRSLTLLTLLGLLAAFLAAPVAGASSSAPAAPSQTGPTPYAATGNGSLLTANLGLPIADLGVADLTLSNASTAVSTADTPRSSASGNQLDATLLDSVELDPVAAALLTPPVTQTAPPDNAQPNVAEGPISLPDNPLAELGVSTSSAHARWPGDGQCLEPGASIANGYNETAGATVLPLALPGINGSVATVNNEAGGVTATESDVTTELVDGQAGRALVSTSSSQVDEVTLLEGTPLEIGVSVGATPTLTATATGTPGGANVEYNAPLVELTLPGGAEPGEEIQLASIFEQDTLVDLLAEITGLLEATILAALGDAGVLVVDVEFAEEQIQNNPFFESEDGTQASGSVSVARVNVQVLPGGDLIPEVGPGPLLDTTIEVAPLSAAVAVSPGGVICPPPDNALRDIHKDVSQADVAPGGQFDYTLTIPNRGPCTLTDVVVVDRIQGPAGFTSTQEPAADNVDTSTADNGETVETLTWNVGELAPEETATFTVTVDVPPGAQAGELFMDDLHAEGVCDGTPVDQTRELDLPSVTDQFNGPCDLQLSNKAASHLEVIPGQTFNYFVHVFNRGEEPCSDVTVTDTLDDRLSFVSCTDDCTNQGQEVIWSGETVPGGSGTTYTVTALVNEGAEGTLENVAVIDSPDDEDGPVTVTHDGPAITDQSVLAPPNPPVLDPFEDQGLPRTGNDMPMGLLAGLGLAGLLGLGVRRRLTTA